MKKIDENSIGYRIRVLRRQKGYGQQELADILGKSLRTIQKYETGEIEISISMINELARHWIQLLHTYWAMTQNAQIIV